MNPRQPVPQTGTLPTELRSPSITFSVLQSFRCKVKDKIKNILLEKLIIYFLFRLRVYIGINLTNEEKLMYTKFNILNLIKHTLMIVALLCVVSPSSEAARGRGYSRRTVSSIMIDASTGDVISANNADQLRYPASLTKVMTLYIAFDALEKGLIKRTDKLKVSRNAANKSPSKLGLRAGSTISVDDAIMSLVVKSANDSAAVLAEGIGYTEENFAKTMTNVAKELGMKNTTFKNASGLPNRYQKTTARDMAVLGAAMFHHFPKEYKLFTTRKFTYEGRTYYSHNNLLKTFNGADGLKTGFTNAAGFNIITSAHKNGQRVIAVTMGHNTAKLRDRKVAKMMNGGLQKLALLHQAETTNLYASINERTPENSVAHLVDKKTIGGKQGDDQWGIQVGAFSNYAKARNYAVVIKKTISKRYALKSIIDIEPAQKGSAVLYRSKLIGMEKNEADKTCSHLKKRKKSCIVIASDSNQQLVLAHKN